MAQTGYTPILIYASGTTTNVPLAADLTSSASGAELALNYADGKLFYKDSGGVVQVLATKGGVGNSSNTQILYNSSGLVTGSANMTYNGSAVSLAANLLFTDATYDIGASGVTRPRNLYLSNRIVTGGYVGIGGTPSFALDITLNPATATSPSISVSPSTGTNGASMIFNNTGNGSFLLGRSNSAGTGSGTTLSAYSTYLWNTGTTEIEIGTNNTRAMQIDFNQRIGINSPTFSGYQLYVVGQSNNVGGRFNGTGTGIGAGGGAGGVGGILATYDANASGSNTSMGGIRLSSSPGSDAMIWKLSVNTTPYLAFGWDDTNTYARMSRGGYWAYGLNIAPDSNIPYLFRGDPGSAATPMFYVVPTTTTQSSSIRLDNGGAGSFYLGRSSSVGTGSSNTLGNYDSFVWNTGLQKIYFGTNNATAMYMDTNQYVYVSTYLETPSLGVVSSSTGSGNMKFQCTGTPAGLGYVGINAFTNSVFALGSAGGTNFPMQFYTNGGVAAQISTARGNQGYRLIQAGIGLSSTNTSYSGGISVGGGASPVASRNMSVVVSAVYASGGGVPQWCSNWASSGQWALGPDTASNDLYLRFGLYAEDSDGMYWTGTYAKLKVDTLTQTSDYRIKENVRPYEQDALAALRLFSPKRFNKIVQHDPTTSEPPIIRDEIGYIAHEAQEHIPELVTGVKDAVDEEGRPIIQGLDYDRMGPVLHRALLQLEDKFNAYVASHP